MSEKRYAIVRVDNKCPEYTEDNIDMCIGKHCDYCYGDTKEQLIRKIVQVMLRRFKKMYKGKFLTIKMVEKQYLEVAKEIVEFLGVE